jgi:hypothetical protein
VIETGGSTAGGFPASGPGLGGAAVDAEAAGELPADEGDAADGRALARGTELGVAVAVAVDDGDEVGVGLAVGATDWVGGAVGDGVGWGRRAPIRSGARWVARIGPSVTVPTAVATAIGRMRRACRAPARRARDAAMQRAPYSGAPAGTIPGCPRPHPADERRRTPA